MPHRPIGLDALTRRQAGGGHRLVGAPVLEIDRLLFPFIDLNEADPGDDAVGRRRAIVADQRVEREIVTHLRRDGIGGARPKIDRNWRRESAGACDRKSQREEKRKEAHRHLLQRAMGRKLATANHKVSKTHIRVSANGAAWERVVCESMMTAS